MRCITTQFLHRRQKQLLLFSPFFLKKKKKKKKGKQKFMKWMNYPKILEHVKLQLMWPNTLRKGKWLIPIIGGADEKL
jgi:hypothetical protein